MKKTILSLVFVLASLMVSAQFKSYRSGDEYGIHIKNDNYGELYFFRINEKMERDITTAPFYRKQEPFKVFFENTISEMKNYLLANVEHPEKMRPLSQNHTEVIFSTDKRTLTIAFTVSVAKPDQDGNLVGKSVTVSKVFKFDGRTTKTSLRLDDGYAWQVYSKKK